MRGTRANGERSIDQDLQGTEAVAGGASTSTARRRPGRRKLGEPIVGRGGDLPDRSGARRVRRPRSGERGVAVASGRASLKAVARGRVATGHRRLARRWDALASLGPGLVAGAADNDPTTVGAVSVVGSTTGYRLAWLAVLVFPALGIVQLIAAQIGAVTGRDLQAVATARYGRGWASLLFASVVATNVVTIAADLEAGAAALGLLTGIPGRWFVVPLAAGLLVLLVTRTFGEVEGVLKLTLTGLFAYLVAAVVAHPNWASVATGSFVPRLAFDRRELSAALALLGTTVTSYVYVWQSIGLAERAGAAALRQARRDALSGAGVSALVIWSILVSAGRLHARGLTVHSAQDAALALAPLVGHGARYLFGAGLLASALLALPVLIATTAYVAGAQFHWRRGLSVPARSAGRFYATMAASAGLGVALSAAGVPAITMLVVASVVGGLTAPISLSFLVRTATDVEAMAGRPISRPLALGGWALTALTVVLAVAYLALGA